MNHWLAFFAFCDFAFLIAAPDAFPWWFFAVMNAQATLLLMLAALATIKPSMETK